MRERWALFESPSLGEGKLDVRSLEGTDELNHLFRFDIQLVRPGVLSVTDDVVDLLDRPATLWLEEDGKILGQFHGIVAEASIDVDTESDFTRIDVQLVPRMWLLTQRRGNEIFLDRTIPQILTEKLQAIGLVADQDFVFSLLERYPAREFVAQHDETDYAFFSRLCEQVGMTTFFEHHEGRDVLVLSDTSTRFRPIVRATLPVRHRREHPAAYGIRTTLRRGPADAEAHDYNYRTPQVTLRAQKPVALPAAVGRWVDYGSNPKTSDETATVARLRKEELGARHHVVEGRATEMSVRAGGTFVLTGVGADQSLLLTKIVYRFRSRTEEGGIDAGWENQFFAMPAKTPFRPPRITPWPRVPGLMNAVVDGAIKGDYAELDEAGRYHLRMAYDRSDRTDLGATHPVRMMQPHSGANYGMHFPLRPGADVLVGFVNGDPDRPVIVGASPNPMTSSPVQQQNQTQNVLRTGSNNEMVIEDQHGIERIRIHTPHQNTTIQLGSVEEPEEGALTSTNASISEASRISNNEATTQKNLLADTSTAILGRSAVIAAGVGAVTQASERGLEDPSSFSLSEFGRDLKRFSTSPEDLAEQQASSTPVDEDVAIGAPSGGLWSGIGSAVTSMGTQTAFDLVRAVARTTDDGLDRAIGRAQGEPLGEPVEPAAIVASTRTAALVGREVGMVFGDRVAALSSFNTASVMGAQVAQLKSPKAVEIAAGEEIKVTTAGEFDMEAKLVRIVGGYYPEAEAPPLDEGTSVGVMARRDLRFMSIEHCIVLCAKKNVFATAHTGDVRIRAKKTISMNAGSIVGSAGSISTKSSGDTKIDADGDILANAAGGIVAVAGGSIAIYAGSVVTITGSSITLIGPVTVEGDLTVTGKISGG
jgi:type VI secretion system VgrG family protein